MDSNRTVSLDPCSRSFDEITHNCSHYEDTFRHLMTDVPIYIPSLHSHNTHTHTDTHTHTHTHTHMLTNAILWGTYYLVGYFLSTFYILCGLRLHLHPYGVLCKTILSFVGYFVCEVVCTIYKCVKIHTLPEKVLRGISWRPNYWW